MVDPKRKNAVIVVAKKQVTAITTFFITFVTNKP